MTNNRPDTTEPNESDKALLASPPLNTLMPIKVGELSIDSLETKCSHCREKIPSGSMFGYTTAQGTNCVEVRSVAVCKSCRIGTRLSVRLYGDGSSMVLDRGIWKKAASLQRVHTINVVTLLFKLSLMLFLLPGRLLGFSKK